MNWKNSEVSVRDLTEVLSRHLLGGTEENHKILGHGDPSPGRDPNNISFQCKFRGSTLCQHPRYYCDMTPESRNSGANAEVHC
jgi:hypothetical protein